MRSLFSLLLLIALFLASCARSSPETTPTQTAAAVSPTLPPTLPPPTPTDSPTATSAKPFQPGESLPRDHPLIAFETGDAQNKTLFLADPAGQNHYEFNFPAAARFTTPFLAGRILIITSQDDAGYEDNHVLSEKLPNAQFLVFEKGYGHLAPLVKAHELYLAIDRLLAELS